MRRIPSRRLCDKRALYLIISALLLSGCAYRLLAGPLVPLPEVKQAPEMKVADDGTVTYVRERLEISLRPMTDEELNRQFSIESKGGIESTNPYTFGDWKPMGKKKTPSRFTVFYLEVKNYAYPKMMVDPLKMTLVSENGRKYSPLSFQALREYYYPFAVGYAGNPHSRFEDRKDILRRTLYPVGEVVFGGQKQGGYVVFPRLHDDVRRIKVQIEDIVLRYDFRGEPVETMDIVFYFQRDVHREK